MGFIEGLCIKFYFISHRNAFRQNYGTKYKLENCSGPAPICFCGRPPELRLSRKLTHQLLLRSGTFALILGFLRLFVQE